MSRVGFISQQSRQTQAPAVSDSERTGADKLHSLWGSISLSCLLMTEHACQMRQVNCAQENCFMLQEPTISAYNPWRWIMEMKTITKPIAAAIPFSPLRCDSGYSRVQLGYP